MIVFIVIIHRYVVFPMIFTNSKPYRFLKHQFRTYFHAYFYCFSLNFL